MSGAAKTPLGLSNPPHGAPRGLPHPAHPEVGLEGSPGHTHEAAGVADASQAGTDVIPDADAAPADPLPHCQLQEEQGQPDDDEQDQVWDQVGTWKGTERSSQISLLQGSQGQMDVGGQAGQSWDRLCLVHRSVCKQPQVAPGEP